MKLRNWVLGLSVASVATLVYGALVEANRLEVVKLKLRLPKWPEKLDGYKIALLGDLHLRDAHTIDLSQRAVAATLDEEPDMIVLLGDYVGYWKPDSEDMLYNVLGPLLLMEGNVVAIPGNHDHWEAPAHVLEDVMESLNIRLLQNELWRHGGVTWIGVDSMNALKADPEKAFKDFKPSDTAIALWHEPDCVDLLPDGCALMLSGHSHGGQFTFPWGWTPMHTRNGSKYVRGFYPHAPTELYVNRGLGTTGPPSRLNCTPEVTILTLDA